MIIGWRCRYDHCGFLDTFPDPVIGNPAALRWFLFSKCESFDRLGSWVQSYLKPRKRFLCRVLLKNGGKRCASISIKNSVAAWSLPNVATNSIGPRKGLFMTQGKKTRIRVRSSLATYVGQLLIPPMRNRISDVLNDESVLFINLTDVVIDDTEHSEFVALNKTQIESVIQLD